AIALCLAAAAHADVVLTFPEAYVFEGSRGHSVTTGALTGRLRGVVVEFTYTDASGSSTAYDVAFTLNRHQWGGYLPFINGADLGESPTYAPSLPDPITFCSGELGMGYEEDFTGQCALVGFGNGNMGGGCTVTDVTITLLGVVPTPSAAAALGLGGIAAMRRRRR
ncbi:MAG TPA: hypothetical protein VEB22_01295, partial [Phycisphaerales bacterium]|nr:hypothetical protein [Phycisphaerales bacterium]